MQGTTAAASRPRGARRARRFATAAIFVAAALAVPWFVVDDEPEPLDDAARARLGGSFVRLSAGHTRYELSGPADAPPVVLVHGVTMPSLVWDHNVAALAAAGRRVVRYDLYGRGHSDRPDAPYDLDLHVRQLEELVAHVAPDAPVDLVGLSMGGIVVSEFARRHPERVRRVALIGPAGIGTALPLAARLSTAPGVGEYLMRIAGTRQLRPTRRNVLHPERHARLDSAYRETIRFRGSRRAVLRSLRHMPLASYAAGFDALGALGKPVLLVWGRHDAVVPFPNAERVKERVRASRLVVVEDAGHIPNWERPEVVNAALVDFLGG